MIGRDGERGRLSAFVATAEGQTLVLKGETGVGKSALLDHVAELAARSGHEVIRAAGVEAESGLPFAGLHQVLHTLLPGVERLDEVHRAVFGTAFGQRGGRPPSVMALGIAVLDLLGQASAARPLLLVVDDGQWLDASSAEVIGFVGRRLAGSSVRLAVGLRSEVASGWDTAALPELPVPALSDAAARELLELRHPDLDAGVRRLVLDHARGNPLALLELPTHLHRVARADTDGPASAGSRLHDVSLTVPRRLQHAYGTRFRALSERVRGELLRGALDGVGVASAASSAPGAERSPGAEHSPGAERSPGAGRYRLRDAEEAVAAGLLEVDPLSGDFVFRHPLVRSSVVQTATPNERRAAHAVLADV
ncbi:AAA family ATPase, partial [Streptomyces sp. Act143]|uniref:AAA family ATPase n=1 Tax=Streptomyces sp. Act143 TaxID=2200760 RepID=UPI00215A770F